MDRAPPRGVPRYAVSAHPRPPHVPRLALAASLLSAAGALCVGTTASLVPEDVGYASAAGLGMRGAVLGAAFAAPYFVI
ncbi:hypothetical protein GUJ93_ZPchr0006g44369 [Zizania palustris]|uniref:Uncharacterized protein n=1 Tax=Zizania palustris TaxID=103762 RepID=A0A8J5W1X9_ZIZPA|nr:hypothetical protein GUJ93_ZPchr0006g44369 [Zizania palustris]